MAQPKPAVDVIIPAFNAERFLRHTLDSVAAQTYHVNKIIVVDDGSTDQTVSIAQAFASAHPKLRLELLRQQNCGASAARNRGIALSNAEWIAFLDADDLWHPEKLAKQLALAQANSAAGVIYCDYDVINEVGNPDQEETSQRHKPALQGAVTKKLLLSGNKLSGSNSAVITKRELLSEASYDLNLKMGEDWDLWIQLSKLTTFTYVDEILVSIRRHRASVSSSNNQLATFEDELKIIRKHSVRGTAGQFRIDFNFLHRYGGRFYVNNFSRMRSAPRDLGCGRCTSVILLILVAASHLLKNVLPKQ